MGEICGMFFDSARVAIDRAEATNVAEFGERLEPVASVVPPHILESLAMEDRWVGVGGCVLGRSDRPGSWQQIDRRSRPRRLPSSPSTSSKRVACSFRLSLPVPEMLKTALNLATAIIGRQSSTATTATWAADARECVRVVEHGRASEPRSSQPREWKVSSSGADSNEDWHRRLCEAEPLDYADRWCIPLHDVAIRP